MRRKKKIDVALIGSNFALKGYLPVLEKIKELNVKIICSKNIFEKKELTKKKNIQLEANWKAIFDSNIQLIILSVPPKVQEKILLYNLRYKKKIFLEKPISTNYELSKKIYDQYKKRGIKFDINLTYLNHKLFNDLKKIIKSKLLGKILAYDIQWSFLSYDYFNTIKSWKTNETYGVKNLSDYELCLSALSTNGSEWSSREKYTNEISNRNLDMQTCRGYKFDRTDNKLIFIDSSTPKKIDSNQSVNTSSTQIDNSASIDSNAPLNRLKDLKELLNDGLISQEQYDNKSTEILNDL